MASPFLTFLWLETTVIINSGSWIQSCHSLVFSHSLCLLHQMFHSLKRWHWEDMTWKVDFCDLKPAKFSVPRVSPSCCCRRFEFEIFKWFSNFDKAQPLEVIPAEQIGYDMWSFSSTTKNNAYIEPITWPVCLCIVIVVQRCLRSRIIPIAVASALAAGIQFNKCH